MQLVRETESHYGWSVFCGSSLPNESPVKPWQPPPARRQAGRRNKRVNRNQPEPALAAPGGTEAMECDERASEGINKDLIT
ncbi:unnamed protein product [Boreogadus saida]